ncbi:aminotransferase class V-fold PLP-dependent enzyme [Saccharibacillus sp. CPCC 101409]|uniref:aminotransferase class V-fold PLP-dependent enzyme n=1 Tax=Saccharibacillus sp. CPCC 101409 TaxID=3058041 RepID=UPI00267164CD|nr:aminotransferase class V-fold PLP-dependent enzyme [Saccharibacillus sp. CPCC 101409]MDO3413027.1 aminotransferase class V-fold PLP-dependent enzyme [Saccharibacillus sp. CPCC 101409]
MNTVQSGFVPLTRAEYDTLTKLLGELLQTQHAPVIIPGEAIIGIEAIAAGIAAPGRRFLNIVTGPYGTLFGEWLERGGAEVVELRVPFDEVVTAEAVEAAIASSQPQAISFVHAEVVTGGSNPAKSILELARRHELISVIDSVSAVGGEELPIDAWGADLVAIGAQKALGGPNGVSAVSVSPRGWAYIESNARAPRNSILSLLDLRPPGEGQAFRVPPSIPTLEARALIAALADTEAEGLDRVIRRHELAAESAAAGLQALGLEGWQRDASRRSTLTTTVRIGGEDRLRIGQPVGIVAPGDGELRGRLLRINHFGANASQESVEKAVRTLAGLLETDEAAALAAVRSVWEAAR